MGRLLGLMVFSAGVGMVLGLIFSGTAIILIVAAACLLCGYHMFCR